ncbi:MAG: alpha-L-rhamnosidase N-terminal domain-containing protein, partial [Candidatus Omnitrophica bacterium]|nr:alpha-L-rhamnosidase N-terminal domain-containing protein [Candidatus Omnitrophota bacterium]
MHAKTRRILFSAVVTLLSTLGVTMRAESMTPTHLRCEYLVNPIGIDTAVPRLSWRLASTARGARQSAYRILVASSTAALSNDQGDLWDSGKIESSETTQIVYSGRQLSSGLACHWKVQTWDSAGTPSGWSEVARWSMGPMESSDWTAKWIGIEAPIPPTQDPLPAQMLRKEFSLTQPIRRAVVHVSALGFYELRLNGERVGDQILAPEWTDYPSRVQYQTYEVTGLLRAGANAVAAHLGDGWYSGRIGLSNIVPDGPLRGIYGPRPRLLIQLEIESEAGRKERVVSDGSWRVSCEGPIRSADILDGEVYDARREKPGWDQPGFEDSDW